MMSKPISVEALMQTPEQQAQGTVTYRVFMDGAYRNVEGLSEWKYLTPAQQIQMIEEVYFNNKPRATA
jgi:hypothetical protein